MSQRACHLLEHFHRNHAPNSSFAPFVPFRGQIMSREKAQKFPIPFSIRAAVCFAAAFLLIHPAPLLAALHAVNLRCEYLENPLGIDTPHPRLSWSLESNEPEN